MFDIGKRKMASQYLLAVLYTTLICLSDTNLSGKSSLFMVVMGPYMGDINLSGKSSLFMAVMGPISGTQTCQVG